ncbi:MAG: hypothetical protein JSU95_08345 [Betaproteobacteria bacterium]|nr:MAG: hypothetical protein JSU95_08345 [Betaproteobacteria bacterium]
MIKRTMCAVMAFAITASANAAPEWVKLPNSVADTSFVNRSSIETQGEYVDIEILRNYDETVVLGNDPVSDAPMYAHRSVELMYVVDCESRKVALKGWKMFEGNFGGGEVVWADTNWGKPAFVRASDEESRAVMASACATKLATR